MIKRNLFIIIGLIAAVSMFSCKSTISHIVNDPEAWAGENVTVKGVCTSKQVVPFTSFYIYTVESSGDSIQVLTQEQWIPGRTYQINATVEVLNQFAEKGDPGYGEIISLLIGDGGYLPVEAQHRATEILSLLERSRNNYMELVFLIQDEDGYQGY